MTQNNPLFVALYFYVQFMLCPLHTAIALLTGKVNPYRVTKSICDVMDVTFLHTKASQPLAKNAMYLCNHRSWGDFFIDQALCNGGAYLSRLLVIPACPMSSLYAFLAHSTWFFNRKSGIDRDALGKYIQTQWLSRASKGVVVYPEGTRNLTMEPLKLKTGVLKMAFDYKRTVQVVITTNKEVMAAAKNMSFQRGVRCVSSISPELNPDDFDTFEDFVAAVRKQFVESWHDAYGCVDEQAHGEAACEPAKNVATAYVPPLGLDPPGFESAPHPKKLWQVRFIIAAVALMWYLLRQHQHQAAQAALAAAAAAATTSS